MASASRVARLLENDPERVNGDVSQVGAVLSKPMLEFAQGVA